MSRIAMCCGTPLIPTFTFRGNEFYCRNCKTPFPMFGVRRIICTPELDAAQDENTEWFREIAKDCIPSGARLGDCEQCDAGGYHLDHATDEAIEKSKQAYHSLLSED